MNYQFSAHTDPGRVRTDNEDAVDFDPVSGLAVLADGMGGYQAGEVASALAIGHIKTELSRWLLACGEPCNVQHIRQAAQGCVADANALILASAQANPEHAGMGTTLVMAIFRGSKLILGHVGDSRCYRLRGNTFEQLSNDHTVIQELLDQGAISPVDAIDHPQRSVLTQALMGERNITPVLQLYEALEGDRYLLCSDGLSGVLTEKEIKSLLKTRDKDSAIKSLIDATYVNGAPDNVTVLIADVTSSEISTNLMVGAAQ